MIRNIAEINNLEETKKRFWSKVSIRGKDDCWNWLAAIDTPGYGAFRIQKEKMNSNRLAYILYYGEIQNNLHVLHKCDNRLCCNPNHLFLGTIFENVADMISKSRNAKGDSNGMRMHPESVARGEKHGNSKLKEKDIEDILLSYFNKILKPKEIMNKFGIGKGYMYEILKGTAWKHVSSKIYPNGLPPKQYNK